MQFVDIEVFKLGEWKMERPEVRRWLDFMGAEEVPLDPEDVISDAEHIVGLAGKRCYKSFKPGLNPNVTKVRSEWKSYFHNILKSGHGSVTEHPSVTFAFENVSRVFTAEMNRHRAGVAISEQSLRYVRFEDIPFWLPNSIRQGSSMDCSCELERRDKEAKKEQTRNVLKRVLENIEQGYKELVALWDFDNMKDFHTKKVITSLLRRIVPLGVATGAVYTLNGRALRHIITMRASEEAEEEICYVFSRVAKIMVEQYPKLLQDFKQTPEGFWYPEFRKV